MGYMHVLCFQVFFVGLDYSTSVCAFVRLSQLVGVVLSWLLILEAFITGFFCFGRFNLGIIWPWLWILARSINRFAYFIDLHVLVDIVFSNTILMNSLVL